MDIALIMFGSLISTMTALSFLEVRRIRKIMESKRPPIPEREPPLPDPSLRR
jgi:hypothetical protein